MQYLKKLKSELAPDCPGFRFLCPTCWTVRAASMESVLNNYEVLLRLWEESLSRNLDGDMRARIIGVRAQMMMFDFLFGVLVGSVLLRYTDNLTTSLQQKSLSAARGQRLASLTIQVLESLRCEKEFSALFARGCQEQRPYEVSEPVLKRRHCAPCRFEVGEGEPEFPQTPQEYYRRIFYEALDHILLAIREWFDQPGYQTYQKLEELVFKACRGEELDFVSNFYDTDVNKPQLQTQLPLLKHLIPNDKLSLLKVIRAMSALSPSERLSFSAVSGVLKLLLVLPATNATSERSFSALRRVKTHLCTTMTQKRLNHLIVLHTHKTRTDSLDLLHVAEEFVAGHEYHLMSVWSM